MSVDFRPDRRALAALRATPEVVALIEATTGRWREEANATLTGGEGYESAVHRKSSSRGPYTVGRVWTRTTYAQRSNAKHQTLVRIVAS